MEDEITVSEQRSLCLTYSEDDFPGWVVGFQLPKQLALPSGNTMRFTGLAVVDSVLHQFGTQVIVEITHHPGISGESVTAPASEL